MNIPFKKKPPPACARKPTVKHTLVSPPPVGSSKHSLVSPPPIGSFVPGFNLASKQGVTNGTMNDTEWERTLLLTLKKREEESVADQQPKLVEGRRLHAKAIQRGISHCSDLGVRKEDSYYPVFGGFHYILVTNNEKLLEELKPAGLSVQMGCPCCASSPCVLQKKFSLRTDVWRRRLGSETHTLDEFFAKIMGDPSRKSMELRKSDCERVAMEVLMLWTNAELPQCVIQDIEIN